VTSGPNTAQPTFYWRRKSARIFVRQYQERSGLSPTAIDELLDRLFDQVTVVPEAVVVREYERAAAATSPHPDADSARQFAGRDAGDVVFLATALAVNGDIWSDDSVFRHQDYADWYRTEDVVGYADIDAANK
jgi:hypothetical protein